MRYMNDNPIWLFNYYCEILYSSIRFLQNMVSISYFILKTKFIVDLKLAIRIVTNSSLPAREFSLPEAQLKTFLPCTDSLVALHISYQSVILHSVYTPSALAWLHPEAALMRVYRENWKLRFRQRTWKQKRYNEKQCMEFVSLI